MVCTGRPAGDSSSKRSGTPAAVGWASVLLFVAFGCVLLLWQARAGPAAQLIGVIGALASLYAVAYLSATEKFGRFYPYLLLFGGSMLGLVLSDNLIALFGFWEMTSVTSFLLIGLWHTRSAARDGACAWCSCHAHLLLLLLSAGVA